MSLGDSFNGSFKVIDAELAGYFVVETNVEGCLVVWRSFKNQKRDCAKDIFSFLTVLARTGADSLIP